MNFTDWYEIKENSKVLIVEKNIKTLESYKNDKYDYIYLKGILENAEKLINSENPYVDLIKFFKELLKENGTMLLAVDNSHGVQYMVGNKSNHCKKIYDSLKNEFCNGRMFTKNELDEILEDTGFKSKKYYYPLPNYEKPSVIFTDKFLPDKNNSKINYNVIYNENSIVLQDEINLLKIMIKENKFIEFTNSYIIELSNQKIEEDIKYYSFNNMRKDKYSLILKMKDDYIIKLPQTKEAIQHVNNINNNAKKLKKLGFNIAEEETEGQVKSRFIPFELLDKQIITMVDNEKIEEAYELIENWYHYIMEKLKVDEQGIVKDGFIDLVFENTFFDAKKNEYIFFDQEWYQENVPIKFILYRALNNLYEHNPSLEKQLPKKQLFEKYHLDLESFADREKQFQKEVIDENKQSFYAKQYEYKISSEEIIKAIKDVKKLDKDNIELIQEIKRLDKDNIELIQEIKRLENEILKRDKIIKEQQNNLNESVFNKIKHKILNNKG